MPSVLGQIMNQITTWENLMDADSFSCSWLKMVKPLIDGRARNQVEIQEPIPAATRMFVPVEHRAARHIRKIKLLEDVLYSVLVIRTVKAVRSVTVVTTLFAGNIQKRKQLQFVTIAPAGAV